MVGLIPLFAVETLSSATSSTGCRASSGACSGSSRTGPTSRARRDRHDSGRQGAALPLPGQTAQRLRQVCATCSTRTSSCRPTASARCRAIHREHPYVLCVDGTEHRVDYEPAESTTGLFGGNSNWRGPMWFPVNYLHHRVAAEVPLLPRRRLPGGVPHGSGQMRTLWEVAGDTLAAADPHLPARRRGPPARLRRRAEAPDRSRTGATSSCSTSTSTATTAPASAPATRPAGPRWSRS